MTAGLFTKMVLIFALNRKPSSPNTANGKLQANRLPIQTANRRDTPLKTQKIFFSAVVNACGIWYIMNSSNKGICHANKQY